MMIKVYCGTIDNRNEYLVDDGTKLSEVMQKATSEHGVSFNRGTINLTGTTLTAADYNKTFKDFGVTDTAFLVVSPKSDCGSR